MKTIIAIIFFVTSQGYLQKALAQVVSEPDFYMILSECKLVVSAPYNIVLKKKAVTVYEGDIFVAKCERIKANINCDYYDKDQKFYGKNKFRVMFDGAPNLEFQTIDGVEHYMVDTVNHIASSLNVTYMRPYEKKTGGLVTKNCSGMYITPTEFQLLKKDQ